MANGPRTGDVHCGIRPAEERRQTGGVTGVHGVLNVRTGIVGLNVYLLHGMGDQFFNAHAGFGLNARGPLLLGFLFKAWSGKIYFRKIGSCAHISLSPSRTVSF